jgi:hypothetical protein
MAEELYTFDKAGMQMLVRLVRAQQKQIANLENTLTNIGVRRHERGYKPAIMYVAKTGPSGIPALEESSDGLTDQPGSAEVTLYRINRTSGNPILETTGKTERVLNLSSSAVAGDTYIQVKEELLSNELFADFEDCG